MGQQLVGVNHEVLVWARERSGQTVDQVAKALSKPVELVQSWESGQTKLTYPQLEELAYRLYKRPIAIFFFPSPPEEPDLEHSFRTLPQFEVKNLSADTRYKVRRARALQLSLYDLHDGVNPASKRIFDDIKPQLNGQATAEHTADLARDYLGITLETQRKGWKNTADAVKGWRRAVEDCGVYVFKDSFVQKEVSGFCLYDSTFPVIYVNNSTAHSRQAFTILHELAHILAGSDGVTKRDDSYIGQLGGWPRQVELFCNRFAATCLLPTEVPLRSADDDAVSRVAAAYKISRHVVLYRLREQGLVSKSEYLAKIKQWDADYEAHHEGDGGGNYYLTQAAYLGDKFLKLAFTRHYEGKLSVEQLADVLNVKVKAIPGLEQVALQP